MECAEIRGIFRQGRLPDGPAVQSHLEGCAACRELFEQGARLGRSLADAVPPAPDTADLFQAVQRELAQERGARARLRSLPTGVRVALLVALALSLLASQLLLRRRPDFAEYQAGVFWSVAAVFVAALLLGARRLLRGAGAPLSARAGERFWALGLLAVPAFGTLLVPLGLPEDPGALAHSAAGAWGSPGSCFSYGALLVTPFLLLAWALERRDAIPLSSLLLTGALAGLAANLLLHAHCPSVHPGHLLLGHATIGLAWALGLGALSRVAERSD